MNVYFLATSMGSRPDMFEDLLVSFQQLAIPAGWNAALMVLDQAPAVHAPILARHPCPSDRRVTVVPVAGPLGLSIARNRLLERIDGEGQVVFCDDDATYPADFLQRLQEEFAAGPTDIGVFRLLNKGEQGTYGNRRYPAERRALTRSELINIAISLNLVMRLSAIRAAGGFNEDLGVGSKGLCGEETELVLKALDRGAIARYFSTPCAFHPRQGLADTSPQKIYAYSRGYRDMLLGYRGSVRLRLLVRWHLAVAIARSMVALAIQGGRANRLVKLKGLAGLGGKESHG
jgi:glycosyltransferase involved in cell wall biosynthesis